MMFCVYRCFNSSGELLYIGQTCNLERRMAGHKQRAKWFGEFATVTSQNFQTREMAVEAEKLAIEVGLPLYNKMHNIGQYKRIAAFCVDSSTTRKICRWLHEVVEVEAWALAGSFNISTERFLGYLSGEKIRVPAGVPQEIRKTANYRVARARYILGLGMDPNKVREKK